METSEPEARDRTAVWEEVYGDGPKWTGRVNVVLEQIAGDLPAGAALDLGCGEGGDAVWLAARGWQVTAIDISPTALARGAAQGREHGVADRITWICGDLDEPLPPGPFDLVSAQFLHSPVAFDRDAVLRRAAELVAPGGSLVVVGHASGPSWAGAGASHHDVSLPSAAEVVDALALGDGWTLVRTEHVERPSTGPDGQVGTVEDSVVVARRDA